MIKIEIDIRSKEMTTIQVRGNRDDIPLEFYELFNQLDEHCQALFRAAVFAYINSNEDVLRDYERASDSPLSKIVRSILRKKGTNKSDVFYGRVSFMRSGRNHGH